MNVSFPSASAREGKATGWQAVTRQAPRDPEQLADLLALPPAWREPMQTAHAAFPFKMPHRWLARLETGNPDDPLLRQVLPRPEEIEEVPGFHPDPLEESRFRPLPGVLHKYAGRVLLLLNGVCPLHCRYCFRRHYPHQAEGGPQISDVLAYLQARPDIREVILSGGDPLGLSDRRLESWLDALASVTSVERLRLHTRFPVVVPERVTESLVECLGAIRPQVIMVLHVNHAKELDREVAAALAPLVRAGISLFNQSVLLRGVNDSPRALRELSERLMACRITPYYLHLLDPVAGAAHFAVGEQEAEELLESLRATLPGYLVPRLTREIAGAAYKIPVYSLPRARGEESMPT